MEHFPEQLIIGKSVPGKQFSYACVGAEDIFANVGKPYLVNEFQKGDSHIFLKKRQKYSGFSAMREAASLRLMLSL